MQITMIRSLFLFSWFTKVAGKNCKGRSSSNPPMMPRMAATRLLYVHKGRVIEGEGREGKAASRIYMLASIERHIQAPLLGRRLNSVRSTECLSAERSWLCRRYDSKEEKEKEMFYSF